MFITLSVRMVDNMKYILVTGGSRGIGKAICLKVVSLNMPILINYNSNTSAAEETKSLIEDMGGTAELMPFNVSDKAEVEKAIHDWEDNHPDDYISILVNNAGVRHDNVMFMMSDEEWHQVIDTTINGFFYLTRCLLKHMMPRKRGGRIINIASMYGLVGNTEIHTVAYHASKGAVVNFTRAVAAELATEGITCNAICPGYFETELTKAVLDTPSFQDFAKTHVPMQRYGKPGELDAAAVFLASDEARYVTGAILPVDGGYTCI